MSNLNSILDKIRKIKNIANLEKDLNLDVEGPHIFNIWHTNKCGASFMIWDNKFYLSSDLPWEEEIKVANYYDEKYSNFELFLLRLKQILQGKSTRYNYLLDS